MPPVLIQQSKSQTNGASTVSTFPSPTTVGSLLTAEAYTNGAMTLLNVSTSGWNLAVKTNYSGSAASNGIFWKIADGTETTITSTGSSICRLHVQEWSGIDLSPLSQTNSNTQNTTTTISTGSITTPAADELIITAASNVASSSGTRNWSNGFSVLDDDATGPRLLSGYLVAGAAGSYSSTATLNTSNSNSGACIASFKALSAPAPTFIVIGAGTAGANGTYTQAGTYGGKPYYLKSGYCISYFLGKWNLTNSNVPGGADPYDSLYWVFDSQYAPHPPVTVWDGQGPGTYIGSDPVPIVQSPNQGFFML